MFSRPMRAAAASLARSAGAAWRAPGAAALSRAGRGFGGRTVADEPFEWDSSSHVADPMLLLQDQYSSEELAIAEAAAKFAEAELRPRVQADFRLEQGDRSVVEKMGQAGLLGPQLPVEVGGGGASQVAYGLIAMEIERVDSGYRSAMSVQTSLVMFPIYTFGSPEQHQRWLPKLASGELIGCFGLTEPTAGSNPSSMATKAVWDEGKKAWRLSGEKTWITHSPIADLCVVWARCNTDAKVRGFVLERGMKGLTTPKIEGKMSLRASPTGSIAMDDVEVPDANRLPGVEGMKGPLACLGSARLGIAWGTIGAGERCIQVTRQYVLDRKQFDKPLGAMQLVQMKLANAWSELTMAQLATLRVTRLKEEGRMHSNLVSMVKRNSCLKALETARNCRDMMGGNGIVDEYEVIRHMMNLETVNTYEGTSDIHALVLGRAVTGLQAFK